MSLICSVISIGYELDSPPPHCPDRQCFVNISCRIAVDEQQVSTGSGCYASPIVESETTCGCGCGSTEGFYRRQSCSDQHLKFLMQTCTVGKSTETGYGF